MRTLLLLIFTTLTLVTEAQVLCIQCYDQNSPVLTNPNNLILNGGLENGCGTNGYFCPNSSSYNCNFTNWICSGGGTSTYAHTIDSAWTLGRIVEGNRGAYFGNEHCHICSSIETDTSCLNMVGCEVSGIPAGYPYNAGNYGGDTGVSLFQTVNGLTLGAMYELEFWTGGEWSASSPNWFNNDGLFALNIGFGNIFLRDPPTAHNTGIGRRFVVVFNATSTSHTIKFTSWGHIGGYSPYPCTELILDDVRLFASQSKGNPCAPTALENIPETSNILVFPNPCTDKLNITSDNNDKSEITLYDIFGRRLLQQEFAGSAILSTEQLTHGLYNYEVTTRGTPVNRGKIIKQ